MSSFLWIPLDREAGRLVVAILLLLGTASLTGQILRLTVARRRPHPTIDNLNSRIQAWWVIALSFGMAMLAGPTGVTLLFALASLAAFREYVPTSAATDTISQRLRHGSMLLILPLQYLLVWQGHETLFATLIPLGALVILPLAGALSGNGPDPLQRNGMLTRGLLVCVFGVSHAPALLTLPLDGGGQAYLLVFLLLVVQLGDVLQYLWGKLAGSRQIAPTLSPGKTVEGTVGGILSAAALGAGLSTITPFTPAAAALIALLLALLGFIGGLAMSAEKRRRGIKDWGSLLPGHGGMLDRLDSLYLSAPIFYYLLRGVWAG